MPDARTNDRASRERLRGGSLNPMTACRRKIGVVSGDGVVPDRRWPGLGVPRSGRSRWAASGVLAWHAWHGRDGCPLRRRGPPPACAAVRALASGLRRHDNDRAGAGVGGRKTLANWLPGWGSRSSTSWGFLAADRTPWRSARRWRRGCATSWSPLVRLPTARSHQRFWKAKTRRRSHCWQLGDVDGAVATLTAAVGRASTRCVSYQPASSRRSSSRRFPATEHYFDTRPGERTTFITDFRRGLATYDGFVRDNLSWEGPWDFDLARGRGSGRAVLRRR